MAINLCYPHGTLYIHTYIHTFTHTVIHTYYNIILTRFPVDDFNGKDGQLLQL